VRGSDCERDGGVERKGEKRLNTHPETPVIVLRLRQVLEDHEVAALNLAIQRDADPRQKPGFEKVADLMICDPDALKDAFAFEVNRRAKMVESSSRPA
jgi:hypothetical protein